MTVFVVMGNDFPEAVLSDGGEAAKMVERKDKQSKRDAARIYWRTYEFELLDKDNGL